MAAVLTTKQQNFTQRYAAACQQMLTVADNLAVLNVEFTNDFYGSGGANALTDAVVEAVLPASSAAVFFAGEAQVATILAAIASNRGSIEFMRV